MKDITFRMLIVRLSSTMSAVSENLQLMVTNYGKRFICAAQVCSLLLELAPCTAM